MKYILQVITYMFTITILSSCDNLYTSSTNYSKMLLDGTMEPGQASYVSNEYAKKHIISSNDDCETRILLIPIFFWLQPTDYELFKEKMKYFKDSNKINDNVIGLVDGSIETQVDLIFGLTLHCRRVIGIPTTKEELEKQNDI